MTDQNEKEGLPEPAITILEVEQYITNVAAELLPSSANILRLEFLDRKKPGVNPQNLLEDLLAFFRDKNSTIYAKLVGLYTGLFPSEVVSEDEPAPVSAMDTALVQRIDATRRAFDADDPENDPDFDERPTLLTIPDTGKVAMLARQMNQIDDGVLGSRPTLPVPAIVTPEKDDNIADRISSVDVATLPAEKSNQEFSDAELEWLNQHPKHDPDERK